MSARVVHVKDKVPGAVYIGRANARHKLAESLFANPFRIFAANKYTAGASRADVIRQYRAWVMGGECGPAVLAGLPELRGKPLACWCRHDGEPSTPENACHGDVLVALLDRHSDDELRAFARRGWIA